MRASAASSAEPVAVSSCVQRARDEYGRHELMQPVVRGICRGPAYLQDGQVRDKVGRDGPGLQAEHALQAQRHDVAPADHKAASRLD